MSSSSVGTLDIAAFISTDVVSSPSSVEAKGTVQKDKARIQPVENTVNDNE